MRTDDFGKVDVQRRFYERMYAPGASSRRSRVAELIRANELHRSDAVARLLPGGRAWLDVGSGDGRLLLACARRYQRALGIDLVFERLITATRRASADGIANAKFVVANIDFGLPLGDSTLDTISAVAVLGFIFDPLALLDEIHRVLKPGGLLILEVLNLAYLPRRLALLFGQFPRHTNASGWDGGHLHNFTRGALQEALVQHGFQAQVWTGSGVLASLRSWWPSMLTGNLIVSCRRV